MRESLRRERLHTTYNIRETSSSANARALRAEFYITSLDTLLPVCIFLRHCYW